MSIKVTLAQMTYSGKALGHIGGKAVFVEGGIAGEEVLIDIIEEKTDYSQGRIARILQPSPHRTEPSCAHFDRCGGCHWQHIEYLAQLRFKEQILAEQMRRIGGFADVEILPTLGMEHPWGYRQKARFGLQTSGDRVLLGFYEPGTHVPVRLDRCPVVDEPVNRAYAVLGKTAESALHPSQGFCTVDVRSSEKETQILFNTSAAFRQPLDAVVGAIRELPEVKGVHQHILRRGAPPCYTALAGDPYLSYEIGRLTFSLQPMSFFQVNVVQARRLFDRSMELLDPIDGHALDVYCGVGVMTLLAARHAIEAVGIEALSMAVDDARGNAQRNGLANARFIKGSFQEEVLRLGKETWDAVILDPPREGVADRKALQELARAVRPRRILYISCNPATLARDCRQLSQEGYGLRLLQPVDMFPHTYHIESIALLEK